MPAREALEALSALAQADDVGPDNLGPDDAARRWSPDLSLSLRSLCKAPAPHADWAVSPGPAVGPAWHADQLDRLCRIAAPTALEMGRRRYHARMLGFAIAPERPEFRPLVTVLLPVFNRAGPLIEAVRSCLEQTWRPIEILVVDDGSTDHPEAGLAQFGDQVRVLRRPNGGVASARNMGLGQARGDFIQLLDSDDLLCPRAIEDKIEAFAAVSDAELCYGQSRWIDMRSEPPREKQMQIRLHSNVYRAMIVDFAFPVPGVMIPRWRMLAMPPFEEDLKRSSDWRFWQKLAFARIKVVGLPALVTILRRFQHSLQITPHPEDDSHPVALLRALTNIAQHPMTWGYAYEFIGLIGHNERSRHFFAGEQSARVKLALANLIAAWGPRQGQIDGQTLSMLPLFAGLRARIKKLRRQGNWHDGNPQSALAELRAAINAAIASAPPLTEADVAFWVATPDGPLRYDRLHNLFVTASRWASPRRAAALADALLRTSIGIPQRKRVLMCTALAWAIGPHRAARFAARWS